MSIDRRLLAFALFVVIAADQRITAQAVDSEYRLKAAFVYQFPQFVEWPSSAWQGAPRVELCVLEPNPFGPVLNQLTTGESLNGRPFAVRVITGPAAAAGCHVLFVGRRAAGAAAVLKETVGRPILTVGESERFLDDGGVIALRMVDRRVRFEVSAANAQKGGLRISSQLLSLALAVRGGPS